MGGGEPSGGRSRRVVLGLGTLLVVYGVLGYSVAPSLMVPLGWPVEAMGETAPGTHFNLTYDNHTNSLTVTHVGGHTLSATIVDTLELRIEDESGKHSTVYTWTESGGTFPIEEGDSVTVTDPMVADRPVRQEDVVRVVWRGAWPEPIPDHCPHAGRNAGQATYAKETF